VTTLLVTSRSFGSGTVDVVKAAHDHGFTIVTAPSHHPLDQMAELLPRADAWIAGTGPITTEHMDAAPNLRIIARYGVGFESVDVAGALSRDIVVTHTPGANSTAVAELTVSLILASLRQIPQGNQQVRLGNWQTLVGREVGALRVGLVGFGRIGQGVAKMLAGFGSSLSAHDPLVPPEVFSTAGVTPVSLDSLLASSDIVSLHAPGGQQLIGERELELLSPGAILVNTARADLVDEDAVADALRKGILAGYAADSVAGDTAGKDSPLLAEDLASRVIVTPHVGAQTVQAIDQMGQIALDNVVSVLAGRPPLNPVPWPLPTTEKA